jgi:biopolymer transport protein ExbD
MGDIAFLLLIFFMATTIFRLDEGLQIILPTAASTEDPGREHVASVIDRDGRISINNRIVAASEVEGVIKGTLLDAPDAVVSLNADQHAPYGVVSDVIDGLKNANAARLSFTSEREVPAVPARPAP